MDREVLIRENVEYAGTNGVSTVNQKFQFRPAFKDLETGRVEIARFRNGNIAPMHLICGLPEEWAIEHDESGSICRVKKSVEAGFVREGNYFNRDEAMALSEVASRASGELE